MKKYVFALAIIFLFASIACCEESWQLNEDSVVRTASQLSLIRGLDYSEFPGAGFEPSEKMKTFTSDLMDLYAEDSPAMEGRERALKALGLIPGNTSLGDTIESIRKLQTRSFYDPESNTVSIDSERDTPLWDSPLIKRTMLQLEMHEPEFALSRELSYALLSQNFGPACSDLKDSSLDSFMACRATFDGGMILLATEYLVRNTGFNVILVPDPEAVIRQFLPLVAYFDPEALPKISSWISDYAEFPFLKGVTFVFQQKKNGKDMLLNATYSDPPLSTEQVLHPEKYFEKRDNPIMIMIPELSPGIEGGKKIYEDTWGEFGIRAMIASWLGDRSEAELAAGGWGGDRLAVYAHPGGDAVAWYTTWDSADDAELFDGVMRRAIRKALPDSNCTLEKIGRDVVFTVGMPEGRAASATALLWQSIKTPVVTPAPVPEKPTPEYIATDISNFMNIFLKKSLKNPGQDKSWYVNGDFFRNNEYKYEVTRPNSNWHFERIHLGGMFISEFTALNTKELGSNFTIYSFDKYEPGAPRNPVDEMVDFMGRQMQGFKKKSEKKLKVAGYPAREVSFRGTIFMPLTVTYTEIFADTRCYIMTFWSVTSSYEKLLPEFRAFRESFNVID